MGYLEHENVTTLYLKKTKNFKHKKAAITYFRHVYKSLIGNCDIFDIMIIKMLNSKSFSLVMYVKKVNHLEYCHKTNSSV